MTELTEPINAKISKTFLGVEDHGIFTCILTLETDNSVQGFGTYDLRGPWGSKFIQQILDAVGAGQWESLTGRYCRIRREGRGGFIKAIGHIVEDKWFSPEELAKEFEMAND